MKSLRQFYFSLCHKVWRKTSISLPLWRKHLKWKADILQKKLDWQHSVRDAVNASWDENMCTLQAFMSREYFWITRKRKHLLVMEPYKRIIKI